MLDDTTSSNLFALTPKTTTSIRWNAKYQSIYDSMDEMLQALDIIIDDHLNFDSESRQQANSLSTSIKTLNFFTYLIFMKNLMSMTNSITTQFQAEKLDLLTASELLNQTVKLLENERSNEINLDNLIIISENMTKKYGIDPEFEFNYNISIEEENLQNDLMITHKRHINLHVRYSRFSKISSILINEFSLEKTYLMFFCTFFLFSSQCYRKIFREVLDQLITEYKEVSKSIDTNVQSLAKISPKYIMKFNKIDAENISKMIQIHDTIACPKIKWTRIFLQ